MQNLDVVIIQDQVTWHDIAQNIDMFDETIHLEVNGLAEPADLVVLPELFTTGFTTEVATYAETMTGSAVTWMREAAEREQVTLTGSLLIEEDGNYYNRLIWMPPDGQLSYYDKRHLFRMGDEHKYYTPGKERLIVTLNGWRICPLICYDLRFPVWSRNRQDYDLLIYVANWPAKRQEIWRTLLQARAIENQCYVIGVNRIETDGNNIRYNGGSALIDFVGQVLVSRFDASLVRTVELDYKELADYRESFPAYLDADNFEIGT
jgi:predicted amidohydrolase